MTMNPAGNPPSRIVLTISLRRMLAAQLLALVIGFPVALMVIFPIGAAFSSLSSSGIDPRLMNFFNSFLVYFVQSATLSLVQWWILRKSIQQPVLWVLGSGLLGVALMPSLFPLTVRLILSLAHYQPGIVQLVFLSMLIGAGFGVFLSGVQTIWMKNSRLRWVAVSLLAWGLSWAIAFPLVYSVLYIKH